MTEILRQEITHHVRVISSKTSLTLGDLRKFVAECTELPDEAMLTVGNGRYANTFKKLGATAEHRADEPPAP